MADDASSTHPLPPHVRWLAVLLKAQADRIATALATDQPESLGPDLGGAFVRLEEDLEERLNFTRDLDVALRKIQEGVLVHPTLDDSAVFFAFQPMRDFVGQQLALYKGLRGRAPGCPDSDVCGLVVEQQSQLLEDLQMGLSQTAHAIEDPTTALRRRGLAVSGDVTLHVSIPLRPLRHRKALAKWADRQARERAICASPPRATATGGGFGLVSLLLLWLGLGG